MVLLLSSAILRITISLQIMSYLFLVINSSVFCTCSVATMCLSLSVNEVSVLSVQRETRIEEQKKF